MASHRYFKNKAEDIKVFDEFISEENGEVSIRDDVKSQLKTGLIEILKDIEHATGSLDARDGSVYTGLSGYALLYLHIYNVFNERKHLELALKFVDAAMKHLKRRAVTFLLGDSGPLAVGAVVYHISGQTERSSHCVNELIKMLEPALEEESDELLYGRAGYLYSLLYVNKNISSTSVPSELIQGVVARIIESGKRAFSNKKSAPTLSYTWYSEPYVGAAHGYAGILFLLLEAEVAIDVALIMSTTDFVLGLQHPSGNFPPTLESDDDDQLIHWCHGAPGCVYLMIKAYRVFGDKKYFNSACRASDVVWKRGLLKKGYGLCHGASGNGYGFLAMYSLTNDTKYLFRAVHFGLWCCGYRERHGLNRPDRPYSLFEGIAGAAYFIADLLNFKNARFPAFEL